MPTILPGDCLTYGVSGWGSWIAHPFERAVQLSTASPVYHVEVYVGDFRSISADYRGVDVFPVNQVRDRLRDVLRPRARLNLAAGLAWFAREARGDAYDVWGLVGFGLARDNPRAWICSELATAFYRACGLDVFPGEAAERVYPGRFLTTPLFTRIWSRDEPEAVCAW